MKRIVIGLAVAGLALLCSGTAQAFDHGPPSAILESFDQNGEMIGGESYPVNFDQESGLYILDNSSYEDSEGNFGSVNGFGDPDPFLSFGIAITDFGAASSFTFTFLIPVIPCPPGSILKAVTTLSGSFTDGASQDGGSITPFGQPGTLQSFTGPPLTVLSDIGPPAVYPPGTGSGAYGPPGGFTATTFVADPGFAFLGLTLSFTGSGGGDSYTFSGSVLTTCLPIPEPSSLAMSGLGLVAGFGLLRRRIARRAA